MAIALSGLYVPRKRDRSFSMGVANFMGKSAVAAQGAWRVSEEPDVVIDLGAAFGAEYHQTGFRAGITFSW